MSRTDVDGGGPPAEIGSLSTTGAGDTITILMPVFNGAAYLREQLNSILEQDHIDWRLVALDDASTDSSSMILAEYAARDSRILALTSPENRGLIRCLDQLLEHVDSPYFALSDQDDVWDSQKLSRTLTALKQDGVALAYSNVRLIDGSGRPLTDDYLRRRRLRPVEGTDAVPMIYRNPVIGHTVMARREVALLSHPMPPDLVFHEVWLVACACSIGRVTFVDAVLGSYRHHGANVIGPKAHPLRRVRGPNALAAYLHRRQRTRRAGLAAVALVRPELKPVAAIVSRRGPSRVRGLGQFTRFMARSSRSIGIRPAALEVLAFAVEAVLPRSEVGPPDGSSSRAT